MDDTINGFTWTFTRQQHKMLEAVGRHWPSILTLETLMHIWAEEVSPTIPMISVLYVYDYMKETGYYDTDY